MESGLGGKLRPEVAARFFFMKGPYLLRTRHKSKLLFETWDFMMPDSGNRQAAPIRRDKNVIGLWPKWIRTKQNTSEPFSW
jgi:endonuclease I